ncbi:MAG: ATP-binding protein [Candidatus Shapirobacteria bacterium]|nr:ATP-binding protein [Candidatus Shapirobacteria bacterium]
MNLFKKSATVKALEDKKPVNEQQGKPFVEGLVTTKDIIAPSALEVDTDYIKIGNKYYRTVFTVINRRFVEINWLSSLINFDASLSVSFYVYPSDGKEILDDLRRKVAEMEAEISTDIQRGRVVNPATQAKLEDALNLQADLVKGEERFFQLGLYMTINGNTKEELDKVTKNLESAMGALMVLTKNTSYQAEDGFVTTLPLCQDRLNITRNMDTTSLATTFPFVSSDLSDDKGIMYGINEHNGSLVIFDRFSMPNYNSVVFATAGAGKSYLIKLEAMRSLMLGIEVLVIDPENEYRDLAEAVGGQYIAFGFTETSKINPFDLSLEGDDGENALNSKILNLHKLFKVMLGEMDPIEESILDRAIMDAYKMKGITPDVETQSKEPPLIEDLYKSLIGMEDPKAQSLAARFEKYIKGSFAGIFNQKTNVNLNSKFVVFGIRNLEDTLRPVAMQIVLDYIWTIVKKELKKRILIVDEAWYMMQYPDSASFLRGIVKRGRKYYIGVTTITQDVEDFLDTPYGKEIVTNSSIQILLKQHSAAIDRVGEVFYLSEGEKQLLLSADKGEGIFFAGQNHVAIRVVASEEEHRLITSNPEEILKWKQQKEALATKLKENQTVKPAVEQEAEKVESLKSENLKVEEKPVVPEAPIIEAKPAVVPTKVENSGEVKKVLFETVVATPQPTDNQVDNLKDRVAKMEIEEAEKLKVQKEMLASEQKAKEEVGGPGKLPSYKELFNNPGKLPTLPPLPPLPKTDSPSLKTTDGQSPPSLNTTDGQSKNLFKAEVVPATTKAMAGKPLFVNLPKEEVKIPQPPQLQKKTNPSVPAGAGTPPSSTADLRLDKGGLKNDDKAKMDYDKLFGNGIV